MVMMLAFSLDMVTVLFKIKLGIILALYHTLLLLVISTTTLDWISLSPIMAVMMLVFYLDMVMALFKLIRDIQQALFQAL